MRGNRVIKDDPEFERHINDILDMIAEIEKKLNFCLTPEGSREYPVALFISGRSMPGKRTLETAGFTPKGRRRGGLPLPCRA